MSERMQESLSALMDGEADDLELPRLLKEFEQDPQVRARWQRYHLVRSLLREQGREYGGEQVQTPIYADTRIADHVLQVVNDEPAHKLNKDSPGAGAHRKPLARFAIAATVAALTVLGVREYQQFDASSPVDVATSVSTVRLSAPVSLASGSRPVLRNPAIPAAQQSISRAVVSLEQLESAQRLSRYMRQHTEHASFNNNQGMMPIARAANTAPVVAE